MIYVPDMPEVDINLQRIIQFLEVSHDKTIKTNFYIMIEDVLEKEVHINDLKINHLLTICVNDLKSDFDLSGTVLTALVAILKKAKDKQIIENLDLLPSLVATIDLMKTEKFQNLMRNRLPPALELISLYPDNTLTELVTMHHADVTEMLHLYFNNAGEVRSKICIFLNRLIKALPKEDKIKFVKKNLSFWFHEIIPSSFANSLNNLNDSNFEVLETLVDVLVHIDYTEDPSWQHLLQSIYDPEKFPLIMKTMLENNLNNWDTLWKVCIRLLKRQITRSISSVGSPINSLLPVVETAFKMDVQNRCRAFKCWDVLIDNFHMETNETYVVKRLKLLIIPLKSNNAKVEVTAMAKFNTWWHLICKFQSRLNKFIDTVLISFLHYSFGKHSSQKQAFIPGLLSANTKKVGAEMFIEMAGHLSCNGCCNVEKLNGRIISTKLLVEYWNDWAYSLKVFISFYNETEISLQQITCAWKSFVLIICELPDNSIRQDIFDELLGILEAIPQDYNNSYNENAKVTMHLINSLFSDAKIETLFNSRHQENAIFKIVSILLNPSFNKYYESCEVRNVVQNFKPTLHYIIKEKQPKNSVEIVKWILSANVHQYNMSFLWTALIETLIETKYDNIANLDMLLSWPLKYYNLFSNIKYSTAIWYRLLNKLYPNLGHNFRVTVTKFLWTQETVKANVIVKLYATMATLNHSTTNDIGYEKCLELLTVITNQIDDYIVYFEDLCTPLTDTLVNVMKNVSLLGIKKIINCMKSLKNILLCILTIFESNQEEGYYVQDLENLLTHLERFLQNTGVFPHATILVDVLTRLPLLLNNNHSIKKCVLSVIKTFASNIKEDNEIYNNIKKAIDDIELDTDCINKSGSKNADNKFTAPEFKAITRRAKKKEATIINKVVDNGEEFIVVKSNWKFNPRKLTENQKEKLQRKREDIPALYQDLSQSQDEFKLTAWKTDSQDSSSTSSKSTNASKSTSNTEEVSNILKNIPSSDVVPKIIENIMSENAKKDSNDIVIDETPFATPKIVNQLATTKEAKSPRMALKDRVFRNVRSLIEKSNLQKGNENLSESLIQVENVPKTPTSNAIMNMNLVNSAPPNIGADRPSRVKRKPKKFEDVEVFSLKRGRRSLSQSDSQTANDLCESLKNNLQDTKEKDSLKETLQEEIISETNSIHPHATNDIEKRIDEACKILPIDADCDDRTSKTSFKEPNEIKVIETCYINTAQNEISEKKEVADTEIELHKDIEVPESEQNVLVDNKVGVVVEKSVPKILKTPKSNKKEDTTKQNIYVKKSSVKKSRIEKELAIDTVEGHPFLKNNSERRVTRKNITNPLNSSRRKSLSDKLNKSKTDTSTNTSKILTPSTRKKTPIECIVIDSQEKFKPSGTLDDLPLSEDVIESSQDSTLTTISATSKSSLKKSLVESVPLDSQKIKSTVSTVTDTQTLLNESESNDELLQNSLDSKDDTDIPQNKTAAINKSDFDTENMDTESICPDTKDDFSDVIMINDDEESPIVINNTDDISIGTETQEIAEADTEPTDATYFKERLSKNNTSLSKVLDTNLVQYLTNESHKEISKSRQKIVELQSDDDITKTISESAIDISKSEEINTASSPLKDEEQRKKDFLNNTFEISPIKSMSPVKEKKSPSPETSSDYVVIRLSSPVQSNGEPFEKCDSPEIFTEDKVSPDKRDLSPPRDENNVNSGGSPSSSLSLKKNRPQVRAGGRAAQMLGLCVPDRLQSIINSERSEPEDTKKCSSSSTPARRNLRILYSSVGDSNDNSQEKEDSEIFLKFTKSLPTADCSPSCPILKRKLAEISDEATASPASKRKRVSFHDPPVSTTVSVQKYIEPCGIRSPQNSVLKRLERQNLRSQQTALKSQKRLDNVFKLDSVLTKTVESFVEIDLINNESTEDTQSMSLDETPAVEIVKNSDLNDFDPICPELLDCTDPIDNIASDLSSPTMKNMFLKELESKIATVGDLAKLSELEVNRLCIKAPKVNTAKKVLNDYALKRFLKVKPVDKQVGVESINEKSIPEINKNHMTDIETQTNIVLSKETEVQTNPITMLPVSVQTENMTTCHSAQTEESGSKSTEDIIISCLAEKQDFVKELTNNLEMSSKVQIAEKLPFKTITEIFLNSVTNTNTKMLITKIMEKFNSSNTNRERELSFLQDYLCDRFGSRDLILFCSQLLAKIHDK